MSETPSCCMLSASAPFHSYEEVLRHLDSLGMFHMDMGLGRMERSLRALGLTKFRCPAVQVVGTNGKGSTSVFLQSIAMAHGMNVGLYTSPHFVWPEERIQLNHTMLPRRVWPALADSAVEVEKDLTYFELLTVMAAEAFQTSESDLMIFEAGLGGRYDATTSLPVDMVCFAPIGMDHMNVLGDTLAAIADDKSDALRAGVSLAVSAPQQEEARSILLSKAEKLGIPLCSCPTPEGCDGTRAGKALWECLPDDLKACSVLPDDVTLGLRGAHQRMNAQTAVLAWVMLCQRFHWKTDAHTIALGLSRAFIPGRLQFAPAGEGHPAMWLDGAHNPHGMTALLTAVEGMSENRAPRSGGVLLPCRQAAGKAHRAGEEAGRRQTSVRARHSGQSPRRLAGNAGRAARRQRRRPAGLERGARRRRKGCRRQARAGVRLFVSAFGTVQPLAFPAQACRKRPLNGFSRIPSEARSSAGFRLMRRIHVVTFPLSSIGGRVSPLAGGIVSLHAAQRASGMLPRPARRTARRHPLRPRDGRSRSEPERREAPS